MIKRNLLIFGSLFLALLGVLAGLYFFRADTFPTKSQMGPSESDFPASTAAGLGGSTAVDAKSDARRARTQATSVVMPPPDIPVLEVISRLASAAKSGNISASCRIAADLQDCAARKTQLAAAGAMEQSIRTTGASSKMLENLAGGLLASSDRLEAKCAGITDQQLALAFDYQIKAAKGNPGLARWLVANPALDRALFMDQLDAWQDYRAFADNYISAALVRPDANNLPLLLSAYKPRSYPSAELIHREDPGMFLALVDVAQGGGANLPPDFLEHARALRSDPNVVSAASRQRSQLEDAGWGSARLGQTDFTPGPMIKPSVDQCSQG